MREQPYFFNRNEHQLFSILHQPSDPNGKGFVFCHPFAEEKLWAHRVYVNYARELTSKGYSVLRFDYMGHGDSSGSFEDSDIESRLKDIECAVRTLTKNENTLHQIGLIGLRFGATLAALVAEENHNIYPLILWEPVDKGAQHMKEMIRINLSTQMAVYKEIRQNTEALVSLLKSGATINIDGYEIKYPLYEQINTISLSEEKSNYSGAVLLIQINKREGQSSKRIDTIAKRYKEYTSTCVVEQPFWKEIREYYTHARELFDTTSRWIQDNA